MARTKSSTQRPETIQQEKIVLKYRTLGWSFEEIAVKLDKTQAYIYQLYSRAIKAVIREDAQACIEIESLRMDKMLQAPMRAIEVYATQAREEKNDEKATPIPFEAIDTVLKISERRAKLFGLDKPVKHALTDPEGKSSQEVLLKLAAMPTSAIVELEKKLADIEHTMGIKR
jgi:transcriptional regulator